MEFKALRTVFTILLVCSLRLFAGLNGFDLSNVSTVVISANREYFSVGNAIYKTQDWKKIEEIFNYTDSDTTKIAWYGHNYTARFYSGDSLIGTTPYEPRCQACHIPEWVDNYTPKQDSPSRKFTITVRRGISVDDMIDTLESMGAFVLRDELVPFEINPRLIMKYKSTFKIEGEDTICIDNPMDMKTLKSAYPFADTIDISDKRKGVKDNKYEVEYHTVVVFPVNKYRDRHALGRDMCSFPNFTYYPKIVIPTQYEIPFVINDVVFPTFYQTLFRHKYFQSLTSQ